MTLDSPSELQRDALRELANVGGGHAVTALSRLLAGRRVRMELPRVELLRRDELALLVGGADEAVVTILLGVSGDIRGPMLLVLPERSALELSGLLLNEALPGALGPMHLSALQEMANILGSACLSAMSGLTKLRLLPTTPTLTQAAAGRALDEVLPPGDGPLVVLESGFGVSSELRGQLLFIVDRASLGPLFAKLGV